MILMKIMILNQIKIMKLLIIARKILKLKIVVKIY